ncbi:MAG: hypothetical protein K2W82_01935 [Candidatus Obscuribacterales bacterium]|nr:hypothetical protein [Candidatus Obscuribacterales bacterium]
MFQFLFRFLSTPFFVALAIFALVNFGLKSLNPDLDKNAHANLSLSELLRDASSLGNPWSFWISKSYLSQTKQAEIIVFGSSQMGSAMACADAQHLFQLIDVVTHRHIVTLEDDLKAKLGKPAQVLSLSTPGSMVSDGYMASHVLFKDTNKPKLVIVSIAPRDFIDNTLPLPAATEQFKFFSRFMDTSAVESFAYTEPFAWLDFKLSKMPLRLFGSEIQQANKSVEEESAAGQQVKNVLQSVTAVASAVKPGQWIVPANLPPVWADNSKEYINRFKNPGSPNYKAEMDFFRQWLKEMNEAGIEVLVVGMPSLPMNRQLLPDSFWSGFRTDVANACRNYRAEWLDLTASEEFVRQDYLDTVHLNAHGGFKLFERIATYITSKPKLACALSKQTLVLSVQKKPL